MAESATAEPDAAPPKRRLLPMAIGLAGALVLGAGGFFAVWSGLILAPAPETAQTAEDLPAIDFVAVDPVTITLPEGAGAKHLRFTAQIEVEAPYRQDVAHLLPRILDVLNGYLRAVDVAALRDPAALTVIRAQLLRRIQLVTGEGRVRDLLVTEFVLN
ncbi:MAG: hypothetical protein RIR62_3083 [Pseudomonadota bacterium]|jgi:flagellar FliL protein